MNKKVDINLLKKFKSSLKNLKAGKIRRVPLCDYHGTCRNKAYREVYPMMLKNKEGVGWSYLCKKHFKQEQKRYKNKLPYANLG